MKVTKGKIKKLLDSYGLEENDNRREWVTSDTLEYFSKREVPRRQVVCFVDGWLYDRPAAFCYDKEEKKMTTAERIIHEADLDVSSMIEQVGIDKLPISIGVDYSLYEFADGSGILYTEDPDGMVAVEVDLQEEACNISDGIVAIETARIEGRR